MIGDCIEGETVRCQTDNQTDGQTNRHAGRWVGRHTQKNTQAGGETGIRLWKTMENNYK